MAPPPPARHADKPTLALMADAGALHAQRWALALRDSGYRVTLYSHGAVEPFSDIPVVSILGAALGKGKASPLRTAAEYRRVHALLNAADLVHVHYLPATRANIVFAKLPRVLVSPWGSDVLDRLEAIKTPAQTRWIRFGLAQAHAIPSLSRYLMGQLTKRYGARPEQLHHVPWGVDLALFDSSKYPTPAEEPFTIGFFKHLRPIYGADVLLNALSHFSRKHAGPWRCLLYGSGPLEAELKEQARSLGIADRVEFRGRVEHDQIPAEMAGCHVVVSPSVVDESLGVASLEAQALGIPVINTPLGGMAETMAPDGGIFVPTADHVALAEALATIATDPDRRRAMGAAGARFIREEHLDWETAVARVDALQRHLLTHPRQPVPAEVLVKIK